MRTELRLLHLIDLDEGAWNGLQQHFAAMLRSSLPQLPVRHHVAERPQFPAPGISVALHRLASPPCDLRRWRGLPVPSQPALLRSTLRLRHARRWGIDRVINWNRLGDIDAAQLAAQLGAPSCYWDRGAAWAAPAAVTDRSFAHAYDLYLASSEAGRQMLHQRWRVRGEIRVCAPGVAPPRGPAGAVPRQLDASRALRLGIAARLVPDSGALLAIHTLHRLRAMGVDAELWIAGEGPQLPAIRQQVQRLALGAHVHLSGRLASMTGFYAAVDLLLHPALTAAYPLVCAEALSMGLPVVAARIDAVPEIMRDGVDGHCVDVTLPLSRHAAFGGAAGDITPLVYHPRRGTLDVPRLPDPDALALAVADIVGDPLRYQRFSAAALQAHEQRLSMVRQTRRLLELLAQQAPLQQAA